MKFKHIFSARQAISIIGIILFFFLFSVKPQESFQVVRILALLILLFSVLGFCSESKRRYKILAPFKKNYFDSKKEEEIAQYFKRKNIIFNHHPELKVPKPFWLFTIPFVNIRLEPDFFLPEFDVFVEYGGMIDDPDYKKNEYDRKKKLYLDNSLDLISLYPKNMDNLDFLFTSKLLDVIKEREGNIRKYR